MTGEAKLLRVVTYNVHSCIGGDGRCDPARVAQVLAACRADVIALQELDVGRSRTGGIDQAHAIAAHLEMAFHFHPALHVAEERYGDAILTALPSRLVRAGALPSLGETRGAVWLEVEYAGARLQVVNTHLGLFRRERMIQANALLGPSWLGAAPPGDPRILLGDLNAVPSSPTYKLIASKMRDAQAASAGRRAARTFPARLPLLRLDHIFHAGPIEAVSACVERGRLARIASDHLPLVADFRVATGAD